MSNGKKFLHRTNKGRVIYPRPTNYFKPRDVQRIMFAINNEVVEQGSIRVPGPSPEADYRKKNMLFFRNISFIAQGWFQQYMYERNNLGSFYDYLKRTGQYETFKEEWKTATARLFNEITKQFPEKSPVHRVSGFVKWIFRYMFADFLFDLFTKMEG